MMKNGNCVGSKIAMLLMVIGSINWGLIGIGGFLGSDWNIVKLVLGSISWLESIVYILVGVSAIVMLFGCKCDKCKVDSTTTA